MNRYRDIFAGVTGAGGFVLFYLALGLGLPVSLALAAGVGAGTWMAASGNSFRGIEIKGTAELSAEEIQQMLESGEKKTAEIARAAGAVKDPEFASGAKDIVATSHDILGYLSKNPARVKRARKFLSYYLDTTLFIVKGYAEVEASNDPEIAASRGKQKEILITIKQAFDKQLAVLLRNDVMDIDAEIDVLRSTLKSEGLIPDEK
jgi:5-bromo-4-chloroindolyl phosphate hydrolysis protein